MRLLVLTMIAAAGLSASASIVAGNAPQPGTRGPVIQTVAPAPTPTRVPLDVRA